MNAFRISSLLLLCLACALHVQAQTAPAGRARSDGAAEPANANKGVISGRVFGSNGRPLVRAQVKLVRVETGRSIDFAATDEDGRYRFIAVAAGDYRVSAGKSGFLVMEHGQKRAFERGTPVTIADGATLDRIDITLPRSGTIAGRLTDENGDPVEGAMVQLLQVRFVEDRRQLVPVEGVAVRTSNDLGAYRLFGVPPGEYIVCAATNLTVSRNVTEGIPGYAPAYAPGTPDAAQARTVTMDLSQDVNDVDITFLPIATARVAGVAVDSAGGPLHPNGGFVLAPSRRSGALATAPMRGNINAQGEFDVRNVAPGEYVLQASGQRPNDATESEFASQIITVNGRDIADLYLQASSGSTLAGRITLEGDPGRLRPADVTVTTVPLDFDRSPIGASPARARTNDNWTFELRGLTGPRLVRLIREPAGWYLKAVLVNGIDVIDSPMPFAGRADSTEGVEIVLSRRVSSVSGHLAGARPGPATGYVVIFSTDRNRWGPSSRFMSLAKSAPDGTYVVRGLPAGEYHVAAVDRLLEGLGEWRDPEFLESIVSGSTRITVPDGQQLAVDPRLIAR